MSGRVPDWKSLAGDLAAARGTLAFVGLLLAIQIALGWAGGVERVPQVYEIFGLSREGLGRGRIWQLLSHGLLHANGLHFALNGLVLLAVGPRLERIGGLRLWGRLIVAGLLAGGAMHLVAEGAGDRILIGASGSVMAALLWLTAVSPGSRMWPVPVSGKSLGLGVLLASAVLTLINPALGLPVFSDWGRALGETAVPVVFGVSHACHLGGALAGWLGARWTLRPRVTLAQLQRDRRRREGG